MTSPEEVLNGIREEFRASELFAETRREEENAELGYKLVDTLQSILAMTAQEPIDKGNPIQCAWVDGGNEKLSEVCALIEKGITQ